MGPDWDIDYNMTSNTYFKVRASIVYNLCPHKIQLNSLLYVCNYCLFTEHIVLALLPLL